MSRNGNTFASFHQLATDVAADFRGDNGVLDGEIVSLDAQGHPQFEDLMFRRGELFVLLFHPESYDQCAQAFENVLREARRPRPGVWVTQLRDVSRW